MRISVVTPAFNMQAYVGDAIASVLRQTHHDLRMVVVDDGSTDATAGVVDRFADPRLTLIRQANAGVAAARNRGAVEADGDALLFLDADDWLAPTALAALSAALDAAPVAVAAVGAYARVDTEGRRYGRSIRLVPGPPHDLLARLLVQNQFANGGHVLIRRAAARQAGSFCAGLSYGEDWEFFVRLALQGPFAVAPTPEPLLLVRSRPDGAYRRLAADPHAFAPCMAAIFGNAAVIARLGPARLAALRRQAEAENAWIIGRELLRQARAGEGRRWLAGSVAAAPSLRRLALLAAAQLLPLLPPTWRGPFQPYRTSQITRT